MQNLTIIHDTHNGAQRAAGTTPFTAWGLRNYLNEQLDAVVQGADGALLVLGDLFDTGHVAMADVLAVWQILRKHLLDGKRLLLVPGNHDLEKTLTTLSSFQFLCKILVAEFGKRVTVIDAPMKLDEWDAYVIPHLANQYLFDVALESVPKCAYLLVHCNYHNHFAVESDHSLNMSQEQATKAPVEHIIFAHEHQQKQALGEKVVIVGNQFPSSVSDCLGNDSKRCAVITPDGLDFECTWLAKGEYAEQDWRALADSGEKFIRVVGEASAEEASEVVTAIAKFRNKAKALVITNAVKVAGAADGEQIQVTLEEIKTFDVFQALLDCLDEHEREVVKKLYRAKENASV
jgi:DNA repair exonuclease SbcCD nuclease subunit